MVRPASVTWKCNGLLPFGTMHTIEFLARYALNHPNALDLPLLLVRIILFIEGCVVINLTMSMYSTIWRLSSFESLFKRMIVPPMSVTPVFNT